MHSSYVGKLLASGDPWEDSHSQMVHLHSFHVPIKLAAKKKVLAWTSISLVQLHIPDGKCPLPSGFENIYHIVSKYTHNDRLRTYISKWLSPLLSSHQGHLPEHRLWRPHNVVPSPTRLPGRHGKALETFKEQKFLAKYFKAWCWVSVEQALL